MKKFILALFLILATTTIQAELPYVTEQDHTFFITSGKVWAIESQNLSRTIDYRYLVSLNYNYKNKFSIGYARKYSAVTYKNSSVFQGEPYTTYKYTDDYAFIHLMPFEIFNLSSPISLSLQSTYRDGLKWFFKAHIYKKLNLNSNNSIQPILGIGIDESKFPKYRQYEGTIIYSRTITDNTSVMLIPNVIFFDYRWRKWDYAINVGISHGF